MAEPLVRSEHLVGSWDDAGGWSARDSIAGPAGSAGVELPGGVELEVDVADPGTLVGLWVPGDLSRTARVTTVELLGPALADALLSRPGGDPPRILQGGTTRQLGYRGGGVDERLSRLALASADAGIDGDARTAVARGLSLLDAAMAADELGGAVGAAALVCPLADEAAALLEDADVDWPHAAGALRWLGTVVRRPVGRPVAAAKAADMAAGASPVAPLLDVVDRATLPEPLAGAAVAVRRTTDSEVEVRIAGAAAGWWARAHRDDVLLAAAPLRQGVARLLLPPADLASDMASLDVGVTDRPAEPRPPASFRLVAEAVRAGRAAARAERLDRPAEARRRWEAAAQAWTAAGNPARAGQALDRRPRTYPPLLADPAISYRR